MQLFTFRFIPFASVIADIIDRVCLNCHVVYISLLLIIGHKRKKISKDNLVKRKSRNLLEKTLGISVDI